MNRNVYALLCAPTFSCPSLSPNLRNEKCIIPVVVISAQISLASNYITKPRRKQLRKHPVVFWPFPLSSEVGFAIELPPVFIHLSFSIDFSSFKLDSLHLSFLLLHLSCSKLYLSVHLLLFVSPCTSADPTFIVSSVSWIDDSTRFRQLPS